MENWSGKVLLAELTQVHDLSFERQTDIKCDRLSMHYQVQTETGLIVEFWRTAVESFRTSGSDVVRSVSHPVEVLFSVGDAVNVEGKILKQYAAKIIIQCTGIVDKDLA